MDILIFVISVILILVIVISLVLFDKFVLRKKSPTMQLLIIVAILVSLFLLSVLVRFFWSTRFP